MGGFSIQNIQDLLAYNADTQYGCGTCPVITVFSIFKIDLSPAVIIQSAGRNGSMSASKGASAADCI